MDLFRKLYLGSLLIFVGHAQASVELATFTVTKDFNDGNDAGVEIFIECTTGVPISSDAVVYEVHPVFDEIEFIVQDFDPGELDCMIFEDVPEGYSVDYEASLGVDGSAGSVTDSDNSVDGCRYVEVVGGEFICEITNELDQVRVTVDKIWIDDQVAENGAFLFAGAEWWCDPVASLDDRRGFNGSDDHGQLTFFGARRGYRTAGDPTELWDWDYFWFYPHYDGSICDIIERETDSDIITDDSDCQGLEIFPGYDLGLEDDDKTPVESCVIINTRIYAGIPTLSEYGLALLALLMLGIGFVGFRRFA